MAIDSSGLSKAMTKLASRAKTALESTAIDSGLSFHSRTSTGTETMTEATVSKATASRATGIRIEAASTSCMAIKIVGCHKVTGCFRMVIGCYHKEISCYRMEIDWNHMMISCYHKETMAAASFAIMAADSSKVIESCCRATFVATRAANTASMVTAIVGSEIRAIDRAAVISCCYHMGCFGMKMAISCCCMEMTEVIGVIRESGCLKSAVRIDCKDSSCL